MPNREAIVDLLMVAEALQKQASHEDRGLAARIGSSVVRPLLRLAPNAPSEPRFLAGTADALHALALQATRLRALPEAPDALLEATAGLQKLACEIASDPGACIEAYRALTTHLGREIRTSQDGPYLLTNVSDVRNWLGESVATASQVALCRCGASKNKPFCDGTHHEVAFKGTKEADRVADRRDSYRGTQLTVLDNRGTCAHSGFCTDGVPSAFHAQSEPFATPSGARMDEIVRAIRSCPSGALAYAFEEREARDDVDQAREPVLEISKDGPYRITGGISLIGPDANEEPRNQGASFEHYSLCRCGRSKNKPFCSGMHWTVHFSDPPMPDAPTLFDWVGGFPALLRMTKIFYSKYVPQDPLLSPLFARMSPDHPERVAAWLGETFGGPKVYTERYGGYEHMVGEHRNKGIREEQRARWAELLYRSADEAGLPADPEFRAAFAGYVEWGSRIALENSQPGAHPPQHMPVPRWWWVCDAKPGSRASALAPIEEAAPLALPKADEAMTFEAHVKPLFRKMDRDSMKFVFDLWSEADVTTHGKAILTRLEAGTMPCDGAWSKEKVDVFRRWLHEESKT